MTIGSWFLKHIILAGFYEMSGLVSTDNLKHPLTAWKNLHQHLPSPFSIISVKGCSWFIKICLRFLHLFPHHSVYPSILKLAWGNGYVESVWFCLVATAVVIMPCYYWHYCCCFIPHCSFVLHMCMCVAEDLNNRPVSHWAGHYRGT